MQVFISFSSADRKIAEKIHDRLKKSGIDCWICTKDIPPGDDYQACIVAAIAASQVVVLVFSSKANLSPEIAKELSLASKKIVIPARIEDVVPQGSFEYQLSNRQFVDLFEDFDDKLDELADRIKSVLAISEGLPPPPRTRPRRKLPARLAACGALVLVLAMGGWMVKGRLADAPVAHPGMLAGPPTLPVSTELAEVLAGTAPTARVEPVTAAVKAPAVGPSRVASFVSLLGTTQTYDRLNAIRSVLDRLPLGLDVSDANALLQGLGSQRAGGIAAITPHLADFQDGANVTRLLDPLATYDRVSSIRLLVAGGKIKPNLSAQEADSILKGTEAQRASGLTALAPQLAPALNGKDAALVLGPMVTYDRVNALRLLVSLDKVNKALAPEDARILLEGSGAQRLAGITAIANNLAGNLDGNSLALILGETVTYDRANSLRILSDAHRIGKLQNAELEVVLQNLDAQRAPALQLMAQYLPR